MRSLGVSLSPSFMMSCCFLSGSPSFPVSLSFSLTHPRSPLPHISYTYTNVHIQCMIAHLSSTDIRQHGICLLPESGSFHLTRWMLSRWLCFLANGMTSFFFFLATRNSIMSLKCLPHTISFTFSLTQSKFGLWLFLQGCSTQTRCHLPNRVPPAPQL